MNYTDYKKITEDLSFNKDILDQRITERAKLNTEMQTLYKKAQELPIHKKINKLRKKIKILTALVEVQKVKVLKLIPEWKNIK